MWTFISHRMSNGEKLRAKLERAESNLVAAQKAAVEKVEALKLAEGEKETIRIETNKLGKEGRTAEAKLKQAEQENA